MTKRNKPPLVLFEDILPNGSKRMFVEIKHGKKAKTFTLMEVVINEKAVIVHRFYELPINSRAVILRSPEKVLEEMSEEWG